MDPSVCRLHPGVAVTGFCPACLRDRLAGLQPPSSADLRRCKSFSYARSAVSHLEPQRRSCDLFRQEQQPIIAMPEREEAAVHRRMEAEEPSRKSSFGGLLSKKLQQWRRKKKEPPMAMAPEEMPCRQHRQRSFRGPDGLDTASWDARSGPMLDRLVAPAMLSVEDDSSMPVPRSDGHIPVEEDYYDNSAVPGGCSQTRDYYLDSSSSSRRRRSVDRSTASGRNSFSDVNSNELPGRMATNARVSPAIAAEFYHAHQSVFVHNHHHQHSSRPTNYINNLRDDDFSGSFGSAAFRANKPASNKKGIKGWSIWGLIHKKSSSRKPAEADRGTAASVVGEQQVEYPWPELRVRGYNGQMLRCNSSISARSSFSGGAAMIGGSARRSTSSGMEMQHDVMNDHGSGSGRMRMDEVLLERNLSTRSSSYSRSGHDHPMGAANYHQFNHTGVRSSNSKPSGMPRTSRRRSTLGPYSTDPIPRQ